LGGVTVFGIGLVYRDKTVRVCVSLFHVTHTSSTGSRDEPGDCLSALHLYSHAACVVVPQIGQTRTKPGERAPRVPPGGNPWYPLLFFLVQMPSAKNLENWQKPVYREVLHKFLTHPRNSEATHFTFQVSSRAGERIANKKQEYAPRLDLIAMVLDEGGKGRTEEIWGPGKPPRTAVWSIHRSNMS